VKEPDTQQRYYEALRNLAELQTLLKENNIMIMDIPTVMQEHYKITLALAIPLGKSKFIT
jgi:hypothetical protein